MLQAMKLSTQIRFGLGFFKGTVLQEIFQQTSERPDFQAFQGSAARRYAIGIQRSRTKIPKQTFASSIEQNIVGIQVAVQDTSTLEMSRRCGNSPSNLHNHR